MYRHFPTPSPPRIIRRQVLAQIQSGPVRSCWYVTYAVMWRTCVANLGEISTFGDPDTYRMHVFCHCRLCVDGWDPWVRAFSIFKRTRVCQTVTNGNESACHCTGCYRGIFDVRYVRLSIAEGRRSASNDSEGERHDPTFSREGEGERPREIEREVTTLKLK